MLKQQMASEDSRLRSIIQDIGIPLKNLPFILDRPAEQCLAWWSGQSDVNVSDISFSKISSLLSVNENSLYDGSYCRNLARSHLFGNHNALPDRYLSNQNSFMRTSEHIYRYLSLTRGNHFADSILVSLNVSPLAYSTPDLSINLTYFSDLLAILSQRGLSTTELDTLASIIFITLKQRIIGQSLSQAESYEDIYKLFIENYNYFDSNFELTGKFIGKSCTLTTSMSLDGHKDLKHDADFQRLLRYRMIFLTWIPYLAGLTPRYPTTQTTVKGDSVKVVYSLGVHSEQPKQRLSLVPNF